MKPRLSLNSVRVRLALWNVGVLAFVLVGLGIIFSVTIRANINAAIDQRLSQKAHRAQHFFDGPPPQFRPHSQFHPPPPHDEDAADPTGEMRPRLFDSQGQSLTPPGRPVDMPWDAAGLSRAERGEEVYATVRADGGDVRVYFLPIVQDGKVVGVVQTGNSLARIYEDRDRMTRTLVYLIPVVLLIAGLGGAFLTDRALRPVRRIAQTASRIEAEDLSHRLPVIGDDEFAHLAETINGMLSRLQIGFERQEQAFEQQRRFAADASHELRTPLTIIKANTSLALTERRTEAQYEKTLRAVDTAADRMTRIVQDLLLLARADAGQLAYALVPVSLSEVLTLAAASLPDLADLDSAPVRLDLPEPPLWVQGHADSLVRLFSNLLENAARHTPADGQVTVTAEIIDKQIVVSVADTGIGIAPEHLPHITERFYRVEAARSRTHGGTGLGLSICRSIAEAHGGSLAVVSALGQGTTVRVTLRKSDA
jgi:heavy metal sensor kinase